MASDKALRDGALRALLERITALAEQDEPDTARLLRLAEAYAWVVSPSNSHGGGVKPKS